MNYCSILDAWGNKNNTEGNKNNTEQNLDSNIKEVQGTSLIEQSNYMHLESNSTISEKHTFPNIEHFEPHNDKKFMSCDEICEHIINCRYCNEKMKLKYKSNFIEHFKNNKDTCILILVAIFVYLFFKLSANFMISERNK